MIGGTLFHVHRGDSVTVRARSLTSEASSHVVTLPRITPTHDAGVAISPDRASILYPVVTSRAADIMMVDDFR